MNAVFADTFYFLGLLSPTDAAHAQCRAFTDSHQGRLITSEFVLLEVADALAAAANRRRCGEFLRRLRARADVETVPASSELLARGLVRFESRLDKDWPLTDCVSFVVMEDFGLTQAATGDHHFAQAGFEVLLS